MDLKTKLIFVASGVVLIFIAFFLLTGFVSVEKIVFDEPEQLFCVDKKCYVCDISVCSASCLEVDIYKRGVYVWK